MITHLDSTTTVKQLKNRSRELMLQSYDRTYMHEAEIKKKKHQKKKREKKERGGTASLPSQANPNIGTVGAFFSDRAESLRKYQVSSNLSESLPFSQLSFSASSGNKASCSR